MTRPDPLLFQLQKLILELAAVDRKHYLAGTDSHENDAIHTLSVVLLCWFIFERFSIDLDLTKILKYAIAHDFVEVYAGDVNTFATKRDRVKKQILEKDSLARLSKEFEEFPDMTRIINHYEKKADSEALFVWTVDKMQALILGDIDNLRPHQEVGADYKTFSDKYVELINDSSPYVREIFQGLVEYSKGTYWDRP